VESLQQSRGQIDDILREKLDQAYHKHTSKVILHDIARIACEHGPIDLAHAASRLPPNIRPVLYENLADLEAKISFLTHTDSRTRVAIFRHLGDDEVRRVIEQMPPDDAVTILEDLSERRLRKVMETVEPEKGRRIREIKKHERHTAGRLMTNEFFAFPMEATIGEAAASIRDHPGIDLTRQIFVVGDKGELRGYVPARNMIINPPSLPLRQVMKPVLHKVHAEVPREEVVDIVERYKLPALPVVGENDLLLGVITDEDVVEVIEDIADATLAQVAGTVERVQEDEPMGKRLLARAPWLAVTLCFGVLNVWLMSTFQGYGGELLTFVLFFVPLITGMSGNIGIQCSTLLVRSMATGGFALACRRETLLKELTLGITTGALFGLLCALLIWSLDFLGVATLKLHPGLVGCLVGLGLLGACIAGTILGVFSPVFFSRLGVDPAIASGPIVTAVNDFLSLVIYFLIATGLNHLILG
jgi:magnesium transporter